MKDAVQFILSKKLIAILRGIPAEKIAPVGEALLAGGFSVVEATFPQGDAEGWARTAAAIRDLAKAFKGRLLIGAGTVISPELADLAAESGAAFVVSPNCDEKVIRRAKERGLAAIPGAFTPTEILRAHEAGADFVKLFPTAFAGADYIKAVLAPLSCVRLVATGGITAENLPEFLRAGCVAAGIGSQLVDKNLAQKGDFAAITARAKAFVAAANSV